jgi:hypothetical protein
MAVDLMSNEQEPSSGDSPNPAPASGAPDPAPVSGGVDRPADLPENFWDPEAKAPKWGELKTTLEEAAALKAEKEAAANKPAPKPEDYKVALSEKAVKELFGGEAPELDPEAPIVKALPDWAAKNGVSQEALSELTDLYAGYMAGESKAIDETLKAEIAKLGANGPQRVNAIKTWIDANTTKERADALTFALGRSSSGALEAIEDLIKKASGLGSPSQPGVSEADREAMKPIDRWTAIYEQTAPKGRRRA